MKTGEFQNSGRGYRSEHSIRECPGGSGSVRQIADHGAIGHAGCCGQELCGLLITTSIPVVGRAAFFF
ncbi:MAG: hypothetical protein DWI22_11740 [Planctomycetota bacterium]|nr:MAG: hypothetical protein DWI22_11740 [Planctomycetota bacterium]